ncbi:hypothetical protein AXE80_06470 [Wenyingzhuangia fucanilytica]|uniref:Beta-lactamase-inhibitor-like PepSY-like domain-containing protein n=1 Tax=Wenyingzhuangia fucanilytica TaxID=1790137 RepID=A0A1B1Y5A7_9FLAO|nr:hypothetical protein [Wenyingzhuangia fucanilytica]ANW95944.1 hypothetical protein AXE80_06470 [Wenyingzhuangia fucanilytica]
MKKIILSIAILVSGATTYATAENLTPSTSINIIMNDEFTEVAVDKLPETVINAVKKDYASATISKAFVNASGQYKLELTADDASKTVYVDKDGNWLEESAVQ